MELVRLWHPTEEHIEVILDRLFNNGLLDEDHLFFYLYLLLLLFLFLLLHLAILWL